MFWPDDVSLSQEPWWDDPAWSDGPTFGQVVAAVRPAIRAALLLGWQVDSIEVATGRAVGQSTEWQSIELATLTVEAKTLDVDRPSAGANLHLGAYGVADLFGRLDDGTYAIPFDIPVFTADDLGPAGTVPPALTVAVDAFVAAAVAELVSGLPTDPDDVPVRAAAQGLLWMLYPTPYWRGVLPTVVQGGWSKWRDLLIAPAELLLDEATAAFPANLTDFFWAELFFSLQARGEAHRLPQRLRERLPRMAWLDIIGALISSGALLVDGLFEAPDPPEPIEALPVTSRSGRPVEEITLSIWGGEAEVTLRRVLVFDDQPVESVDTSVAWDYVEGDEQQRPTVVVVAARGVEVDFDREVVPLAGRTVFDDDEDTAKVPALPWDLLIHRVQDEARVPPNGSALDPSGLCAPELVPSELVPPPGLRVVPKHDGVLLMFPATGTNTPTNTPIDGVDIPRVVELTLQDPASGETAWTADVHFASYAPTQLGRAGYAHLCVWVSDGVRVDANVGDMAIMGGCRTGDPSWWSEDFWLTAWMFSAEAWHTDRVEKLPRPWSAVLPWTEARRPDLLEGLPKLDYEQGRARYKGSTLTPPRYCYRPYGYIDTVGFDVFDFVLGFTPFGDLADIGEAVYAWQTGRDKWGRPVTDFQLAFMIVCAGLPIVSHGLLKGIGLLLGTAVEAIPTAELGRLAVPARWANDLPLDQAEALRAIEELTRPPDGLTSAARREQAVQAIVELANDDSALAAFGERLADGRATGWPSIGDALSTGVEGFEPGTLQTPYLRYLRDHPSEVVPPIEYVRRMLAGGT